MDSIRVRPVSSLSTGVRLRAEMSERGVPSEQRIFVPSLVLDDLPWNSAYCSQQSVPENNLPLFLVSELITLYIFRSHVSRLTSCSDFPLREKKAHSPCKMKRNFPLHDPPDSTLYVLVTDSAPLTKVVIIGVAASSLLLGSRGAATAASLSYEVQP